jgi:hypothetical protein
MVGLIELRYGDLHASANHGMQPFRPRKAAHRPVRALGNLLSSRAFRPTRTQAPTPNLNKIKERKSLHF